MVIQPPVVRRTHEEKGRLLHREVFFCGRVLSIVLVSLIAVFILVASKQYPWKEAQNPLTVDSEIDSEVIAPHSVLLDSLRNVCPDSKALCEDTVNGTLCFVFSPTHQGLTSAEILMQTSIGGFLIQAKGVGLDRFSGERWRNNSSLFNHFEETLHMKEATAWISTSSGGHLNLSTSIGCSHSLVVLERDYPVDSLDFRVNLPPQVEFSSLDALNFMGFKAPICSQAVDKEVEIKNVGDVSLEVKRITVSGADCNLDGFLVVNCSGFSLRPGESVTFRVSYRPDFSAASVQRELELDFTSGVVSIHMKADVPLCLINFCKGSTFWIHVKQAIIVLILSALLLSAMILVFPRMECLHKSVAPEHETELESRIDSPLISNPSSIEILDIIHERLESDLRIRVKTEKGRRRRRKRKSSSPGVLNHELASSQSGNSTPSSSLSPVAFSASRRSLLASPSISQPGESGIPSYDASPQQCDEKNTSDDSGGFGSVKSGVGKSFLRPSATFPCRAAPSWGCNSPILTSTSKIALHARAPGTKIRNEDEETKVGEFDEKYTYDIWGDHVFGFEVSCRKSPRNVDNNNCESFFMKSPLALSKTSQQPSVPSDMVEEN